MLRLLVTEDQLQDSNFLQSLVLIGQDVWHVQNRILVKVSRKHPNYAALKRELKSVFTQVGKQAPRLHAGSAHELQTYINQAAEKLSTDILGLLRWEKFQEKESLDNRALRLMSEVDVSFHDMEGHQHEDDVLFPGHNRVRF
jgi:hypothetical protein